MEFSDVHFSTKYWSVVAVLQVTEAVAKTQMNIAIKTMTVYHKIVNKYTQTQQMMQFKSMISMPLMCKTKITIKVCRTCQQIIIYYKIIKFKKLFLNFLKTNKF